MNTIDRIDGILGIKSNFDSGLRTTEEKVAAALDLRDNPAVQVAGAYSQQQPSQALPQLSEQLTQLALKDVQEALNKGQTINDPLEAENERLSRQKRNLELNIEIAEKTKQLQELQNPQPQPAAQAPAAPPPPQQAQDMQGTNPANPMMQQFGAAPQPMPGQGGEEQGGDDIMELIRQAVSGRPS